MHAIPFDDDPVPDRYAGIVHALAETGWSVCDGLLAEDIVRTLAAEARAQWHEGGFRPARVGTGATKALRPEIRNDHVQWLDPLACTGAQQRYFDLIGELQQAINRNLMMGLHAFEGHFAVYTPGACYAKHLDQFIGAHQRSVSIILYLNEGWEAADGGALRLYTDAADTYVDLLPLHGRIVTFLSGRFFHEVLPASRHRISLTGWYRIRSLAHPA
jgi:SM-20-related protein